VHGKVVDWVEHKFEEGLLNIQVRFADKTELCWRIATHMTIEESDLADWTYGDFKQLRVFECFGSYENRRKVEDLQDL
jgi:hypothetical protein